jgi:Legionella pneumophila major outer membrane protein precursor
MNLSTKILALSAVCFSVFADQAKPTQSATMKSEMDPNPCARFGTKDSGNFFIQGEVLWIKPLGQEINYKSLDGTAQIQEINFFRNNFTTGERVGLGYNTSYDGWDVILQYTGYNYHHNNTGLNNLNGVANSINFQNSYSFYYNQGDLDFGRMMKVSRKLKMRPHVGVRAIWLTEKGKAVSTDVPSGDAYSINHLKNTLYGLEVGIDTEWMFAKEFGVYANLGLATMVNQQKYTQKGFVASEDPNSSTGFTNYGSKIINEVDFSIGIRWDKNFSDDSYHFGINFGYEQHSLINLQSPSLLQESTGGYYGDSTYMGFVDPDFTWQAIALGARFDF